MDEIPMVQMSGAYFEHVTILVAAILTPGILDQRAAFIRKEGREPTQEEFAPARRAFLNEWLRTAKYLQEHVGAG
jgi:hypothetical protein